MPSQKTSAAIKCLKVLLHIFNFIYLLLGICILAIGIWTQMELQNYMKLTGLYFDNSSYAMIAVGVVILLVSVAGFYCTAKGVIALLYLYGFFIGLVAIAQMAAGIAGAVFANSLADAFEKGMNASLENSENNMEAWNKVQQLLHCCGVDGPSDWLPVTGGSIPASCYADNQQHTSAPSNHTTTIIPTPEVESTTMENVTIVPNVTTAPTPSIESTTTSANSSSNESTTTTATVPTTTSLTPEPPKSGSRRRRRSAESEPFAAGCHSKVVDTVKSYLGAIIGVCIGFVFLQVAGAILACTLARRTNKNNYEQIY